MPGTKDSGPRSAPLDAPDERLLQRYLAGECTPAEEEQMLRWIAADPARRGDVAFLQTLVRTWRDARPEPTDAATAWREVHAAILTPQHTPAAVRSQDIPARRVRVRSIAGLAASVAALAIMTVVWPSKGSSREYTTACGQRETITLTDGTRITLAPASSLRTHARDVYLTGNALFTVVHDAAHPFTVHTARATITDIGTQFDVRAYADDRAVRVAVVEGRVGIDVGIGRASSGLRPSVGRPYKNNDTAGTGDVATVTDTGVAVTHKVNVATLTAWTQGRLVFEDTPLRDVVQDVGRTFDVEITVADTALLSAPITASFASQSVDDVLRSLTFAVGATFTRNGRAVLIRRGPGAAGPTWQDSGTHAAGQRVARSTAP